MRKRILPNILLLVGLPTLLFTSCVDDRYLTVPPPVENQSYIEEFDTLSSALSRGWALRNTSIPKGPNVWQQGGEPAPWFSPFSSNGTYAGFVGADYTSTSAAAGIISNWLISPTVTMQNGDKIIFYTRALQYSDGAGDSTDYGNRLQVRINMNNEGLNVGSGLETGDFNTPILDINPTLAFSSRRTPSPIAFPTNWTRFEATIYGLDKPTRGRYAFRYFVEDGGSNGNGSGVAVDFVTYKSASK